MRALFVFFAILVPAFAQAAELTIATFNTEFLTRAKIHKKFGDPLVLTTPADLAKWNAPGFRDQKFAEAAAEVAAVVVGINADIIVLNEVGDQRDLDELNAAIAQRGVSYPHKALCKCDDNITTQHVAVLSKIPLTSVVKTIPGREGFFTEADDDDSEKDTGISKGIIVTFDFGGHTFRLYGLHLASEAGEADRDEQRIAQASIIRRLTLPAINAGTEFFIIAGDLNDGRGQPAIRRIQGYNDIWPDLIQTGEPGYFYERGRDGEPPARDDRGTRWTYEYQGTRNQIDHILLSPSILNIINPKGIQPRVPEQTNRAASDHRSFVVKLDLH